MTIVKICNENIKVATGIYIEAYSKEPWNEKYEIVDVNNYISRFISGNRNYGWIFYEDNEAIGVVLGIVIPTVGMDYFRIEDLCIDAVRQGQGYGSKFIKLLSYELKEYAVDSILLNTIKGFLAYKFYLKNDFKEITDSALLLLEI